MRVGWRRLKLVPCSSILVTRVCGSLDRCAVGEFRVVLICVVYSLFFSDYMGEGRLTAGTMGRLFSCVGGSGSGVVARVCPTTSGLPSCCGSSGVGVGRMGQLGSGGVTMLVRGGFAGKFKGSFGQSVALCLRPSPSSPGGCVVCSDRKFYKCRSGDRFGFTMGANYVSGGTSGASRRVTGGLIVTGTVVFGRCIGICSRLGSGILVGG